MKRLTGYALIILVLSSILVFDSCKRGDDDPFFSFRSRKARVTGDWSFETKESNIMQYFSNGYQTNIKFKVTGETVSETVDLINTPDDGSETRNGVIKEAFYRFDKNSKMEYLFHYELEVDSTSVDENTNITTYYKYVWTYKDRATGSWNFLSSIEDNGVNKYKNKERLSLIYQTYNTSEYYISNIRSVDEDGVTVFSSFSSTSSSHENKFANGENAQIWVLKELRNKKIVMERDVDDYTENVYVISDSISASDHFQEKGFETATLKPRQ